jgi:hypothetical protein
MITDKELKSLTKYETAERVLLLQFFEQNEDKLERYSVTDPKQRKAYDAWYTPKKDPSNTSFLEAKVRNFSIDKYDSWFLELKKLQNLVRYTIGNIYYINFFPSEKGTYDAIFFNISKRLENWKSAGAIPTQQIWMNSQTFKSTKQKENKEVILLKFDEAMDTMFRNTHWTLGVC